jgi:hypothetical protein
MLRTRPFQASIETALNYKKLIHLGNLGGVTLDLVAFGMHLDESPARETAAVFTCFTP